MSIPVPLHYTDEGAGLPLVLLHGFPFSGAIWHEQEKALAGLYRLIIPDLRGHGQSMAPAGVYEMDMMAQDLLMTLDVLEIEKCAIMGHSMGGYVALAAYQRQPERFMAFGLIASQANADSPEARQGRENLVEKVLSAGERGARVVYDSMIPRLFAEGSTPETEMVEEITKIMLAASPTGIVGTIKGMAARPDSTPLLVEMTIPFLLLMGEKDMIIPADRGEAMSAVIPSPTYIVVEDAGHMLMMEQPGATSEAIKTFLINTKVNG